MAREHEPCQTLPEPHQGPVDLSQEHLVKQYRGYFGSMSNRSPMAPEGSPTAPVQDAPKPLDLLNTF